MADIPEKPQNPPDNDINKGPVNGDGADGDLASRLDDLGSRLEKRKQAGVVHVEREGKSSTSSGIAQAMRLSTEFVVGICVGAGVGYLIDRFAGTSPWGLIVFLLLGFAAGVLNVLRAGGLVAESKIHLGSRPEDEDRQ